MIVFIKSDGTVASVVSSPFYQGSSLSGSFYLVAPYPQNYSASARFVLADGRYTEYYPMTPVSELPNALSGLAENVTVYEIASKTGEITAKSGTVTAQFTITYNGEIQTTASVDFTVNVGVPSLPDEQTQPTDDEWLRLLELITQLSNKLPANGGMDFTVDIVTVNGAVYYRYIKTYANGTTAEIDVPVITDDGAVTQSGMTKVDIPISGWTGSSAPYTFTIESGIPDGMFVAELMEKTTNGYATRADSIEYNADGSMTIKSNSKYQGMLVFTNNAIFNNVVKRNLEYVTSCAVEFYEDSIMGGMRTRNSGDLTPLTAGKYLVSCSFRGDFYTDGWQNVKINDTAMSIVDLTVQQGSADSLVFNIGSEQDYSSMEGRYDQYDIFTLEFEIEYAAAPYSDPPRITLIVPQLGSSVDFYKATLTFIKIV